MMRKKWIHVFGGVVFAVGVLAEGKTGQPAGRDWSCGVPEWGVLPGREFWKNKGGERSDLSGLGSGLAKDSMVGVTRRLRPMGSWASKRSGAGERPSISAHFFPGGFEVESGEFRRRTKVWTAEIRRGNEVLYTGRVRPQGDFFLRGDTAQFRMRAEAGLTEHHEVRSRGVEVTWILDRKPRGTGDLWIRFHVAGADSGMAEAGGLRLSDGMGREVVRIHPAWAVDAGGHREEVPMEFGPGGAVRLRVTEMLLSRAEYPLAIDPLIEPNRDHPISAHGAPGRIPAIAGNGSDYLVVWEDNRSQSLTGKDIYAARVTATGEILDPEGIVICRAVNDQADPAVAANDRGYLVAWSDHRTPGTPGKIYAARISPEGKVLDPEGFPVHASTGSQNTPSVATNRDSFLVAWQCVEPPLATIQAILLDPDGIPITSDPMVFGTDQVEPGHPAAAGDGYDYLVAWQAGAAGQLDIFGIRIDGVLGSRLEEAPMVISEADRDQAAPAVAANDSGFFVVWQDFRNGLDLFGSRVDLESGQVLDPAGIPISTAAGSQYNACITAGTDEFLVAWQDLRSGKSDVYLGRVNNAGRVLDFEGMQVNRSANMAVGPGIAGNGLNYLIVYEHLDSGSSLEVLGQFYSPFEAMEVVWSGSDPVRFTGGAGAVAVDEMARIEAPEPYFLAGGWMELSISDPAGGDRLVLNPKAEEESGYRFDESTIRRGDTVVGEWEAESGTAIRMDFNAETRPEDMEWFLRSLHFDHTDEVRETSTRLVKVSVIDGTGVLGRAEDRWIQLVDAGSVPEIVTDPMGGKFPEGGTLVLEVEVTWNGEDPVNYQWQHNGIDLEGAVGPVLTLSDLVLDDAGEYRVVATTSLTSTSSAPAIVEVYASNPFVTRNLPAGYGPGVLIEAILQATPPPGTEVFAIEEFPPRDWKVEEVRGGSRDPGTGKIKFGPFFGDAPVECRYLLRPPFPPPEKAIFAGTASADEWRSPIIGDTEMALEALHPADMDPADHVLTIEEVTRYSLHWRKGTPWSSAPETIPVEYVTRAGALWKCGEAYTLDPGASRAPLWWVNTSNGTLPSTANTQPPSTARAEITANMDSAGTWIIHLAVTPNSNTAVYAIQEHPPVGWEVFDIDANGIYDDVLQEIKWGPFFDSQSREFSYRLREPPEGFSDAAFEGIVSYDGYRTMIGGDRSFRTEHHMSITDSAAMGMQIRVQSPIGTVHQIQTSADLVEWSDLAVSTNRTGILEFEDPAAGAQARRFYRTVTVP